MRDKLKVVRDGLLQRRCTLAAQRPLCALSSPSSAGRYLAVLPCLAGAEDAGDGARDRRTSVPSATAVASALLTTGTPPLFFSTNIRRGGSGRDASTSEIITPIRCADAALLSLRRCYTQHYENAQHPHKPRKEVTQGGTFSSSEKASTAEGSVTAHKPRFQRRRGPAKRAPSLDTTPVAPSASNTATIPRAKTDCPPHPAQDTGRAEATTPGSTTGVGEGVTRATHLHQHRSTMAPPHSSRQHPPAKHTTSRDRWNGHRNNDGRHRSAPHRRSAEGRQGEEEEQDDQEGEGRESGGQRGEAQWGPAMKMPAAPTTANSTTASLCSYLQTLRRGTRTQVKRTDTVAFVTRTEGLQFLYKRLPTLVGANADAEAPVQWSSELAETVVMACVALEVPILSVPAGADALHFLLAEGTTNNVVGVALGNNTPRRSPQRVENLAQLAIMLLQARQTALRRTMLTNTMFLPRCAVYLRLEASAVPPPAYSETATVSSPAPSADSLSSRTAAELAETAMMDAYLDGVLLPLLVQELIVFCEAVERRYDAALAVHQEKISAEDEASRSPDTPRALVEACVPRMSKAEWDLLALQLSVLYRTVNAHGVAVLEKDGRFVFCRQTTRSTTVAASDVPLSSPVPETSVKLLNGIPLRAFSVALAAASAGMHAVAGPSTGVVERLQQREAVKRVQYQRHASPFVMEEEGEKKEQGGEPSSAAAMLVRAGRPASARGDRFQRRTETTSNAPLSAVNFFSSKVNTQAEGPTDTWKTTQEAAATPPPSTPPPPQPVMHSFNVMQLMSLLQFCFHTHAGQLLLSTKGLPQEEVPMYVDSVAVSMLSLLQLAVHWAPFCRTTQLPIVLHALAYSCKAPSRNTPSNQRRRTARSIRNGSDRTDCGVADDGEREVLNASTPELHTHRTSEVNMREAVSGATTDSAMTPQINGALLCVSVGLLLQQLTHTRLLQLYPDSASLAALLQHLTRATAAYLPKQNVESTVATASCVMEVLRNWPAYNEMNLKGVAGTQHHTQGPRDTLNTATNDDPSDGGQLGKVSKFTAPPAALPAVQLLSQFLEGGWMIFASAPYEKGRSNNFDKGGRRDGSGTRRQLLHTVPTLRIDVSSLVNKERDRTQNPERNNSGSRNTPPANTESQQDAEKENPSSTARATLTSTRLSVPHYLHAAFLHFRDLRPLQLSPDMMCALLRVTDEVAAFLSIPDSGGRLSAVLPEVRTWHNSTHVRPTLTGTQEAEVTTRTLAQEREKMRLPELLVLNHGRSSGTRSSAAGVKGGEEWVQSLRPLNRRMEDVTGSTNHSYMIRVNPLPLFLSAEGELVTQPSDITTETERSSAMVSVGPALTSSKSLWRPNWSANLFSTREMTSLLQALLLQSLAEGGEGSWDPSTRSACTPVGGKMSRQASASVAAPRRSLWSSMAMQELLTRIAHRLLFASTDPNTRKQAATWPLSDAALTAQALAQQAPASLEDYLTLYLALTSAVHHGHASALSALRRTPLLETALHGPPVSAAAACVQTAQTYDGAENNTMGGASAVHHARKSAFRHAALRCALARCESVLSDLLPQVGTASLSDTLAVQGDSPVRITTTPIDAGRVFPLCLLSEQLLMPQNLPPTVSGASSTLPLQVQDMLSTQLRATLAHSSTHSMATMLSQQLWWTTQYFADSVQVRSAANATTVNGTRDGEASWVGAVVLRKVERMRRAEANLASGFHLYDWVLLPWYVQSIYRSADKATMEPLCGTAAELPPELNTPTYPAAAAFDDYTELEESFLGDIRNPRSNAQTGPSTTPPLAALNDVATPQSGSVQHSAAASASSMLEQALPVIPQHTHSLSALVHIVRYLFLSHPALLSTAPSSAVALSPPLSSGGGNRRSPAEAALPVQYMEVPDGLRQRYVDALHRSFVRLLRLHSTNLEDVVELLHLLWLADPEQTAPNAVVATLLSSGQPLTGSGAHSAAASPWPSLFQRCADTLAEVLSSEGDPAVPPCVHAMRHTLQEGVFELFAASRRRETAFSRVSLQLSPVPVLLFLHSLASQVQPTAATVTSAPMPLLSSRHQALLTLLTPLVELSAVVADPLLGLPVEALMPPLLETLGELDVSLALSSLHAAFPSFHQRRGTHQRHGTWHVFSNVTRPSSFAAGEQGIREQGRALTSLLTAFVAVATAAQRRGIFVGAPSPAEKMNNCPDAGQKARQRRSYQRMIGYLSASLTARVQILGARASSLLVEDALLLQALHFAELHGRVKLFSTLLSQLLMAMCMPPVRLSEVYKRGYGGAFSSEQQGEELWTSVTRRGEALLRCLPLRTWQMLLHRNVQWSIYENKKVVLARYKQSNARSPAAPAEDTADPPVRGSGPSDVTAAAMAAVNTTERGPKRSHDRPRSIETRSLSLVLMSMEAGAARRLVTEAFSPTVALTVATELLRLRSSSSTDEEEGAKESVPRMRCLAMKDGAGLSTTSASYATLLRSAGADSVLRDPPLQPFIEAACTVLDQMASPDRESFLDVLRRDAQWRRAVEEASMPGIQSSAYRSIAGDCRSGGVTRRRTAPKEDKRNGADDSQLGVPVKGEEREIVGMLLEDVDEDCPSPQGTTGDVILPAISSLPLVLDWQPMVSFLVTLYEVDPGLRSRVGREAWWNLPSTATSHTAEGAEEKRTVLHDGVTVMLRHVRDVWRRTASFHGPTKKLESVTASSAQPRLHTMNLHPIMRLFRVDADAPSGYGDGPNSEGTALSVLAAGEGVEPPHWLHFSAFMNQQSATVPSADTGTGLSSALFHRPLSYTVRRRTDLIVPPLSWEVGSRQRAAMMAEWRVVQQRRLTLRHRARQLYTAAEAETQLRGLTHGVDCDMLDVHRQSSVPSWVVGGELWYAQQERDYWRREAQEVQQLALECVFDRPFNEEDSALSAEKMASASAPSRTFTQDLLHSATRASDTTISPALASSHTNEMEKEEHAWSPAMMERHARRRLALLRCDDVAHLLQVLLRRRISHTAAQARLLMETVVDLLPSASAQEVVHVAEALLHLSVESKGKIDEGAQRETREMVAFESRRLLSSIGVLMANDVERFSMAELVWLIARLHTPQIRGQMASVREADHFTPASSSRIVAGDATDAASEEKRTSHTGARVTSSSSRLSSTEALLDVSESFLSAAAARAILEVLHVEDTTATAGTSRQRTSRADDDDEQEMENEVVLQLEDMEAEQKARVVLNGALTVGEWISAVAMAEQRCDARGTRALLTLVASTAV